MKTLVLATFNVRGLTKPHKLQQLIRDVIRYRTDACAIPKANTQQLSDIFGQSQGHPL